MLSLLAALAFATPPDFALPLTKAEPLPERLSRELPQPARRDIRGCIVADDGSAMFWGRDSISAIDFEAGVYAKIELFRRRWQPDAGPITGKQKAWLEETKAVENFEDPFFGAGAISVVSAKSKSSVQVQYSFHPNGEDRFRAALDRIDLESADPKDNWRIHLPDEKGFYTDFVAGVNNESLLGQYYKDEGGTYRFLNYGLVGTGEAIKGNVVPGIVPVGLDTSRNMILCFTSTEEGTPLGLLIEALWAEKERQRVTHPGGRISVTGLLPHGRIVATCLPFRDDDDDPKAPKWGLYQCDPPYNKAKYLGPYRLVGSSRNGQWLLIENLKTKKAWLVQPS